MSHAYLGEGEGLVLSPGKLATLLAKHYCYHLESGITFSSIANDSETNNSVCQAILTSFAKALNKKTFKNPCTP